MNTDKILTAEEFISQYPLTERLFKATLSNGADSLVHKAMIEFAKLHVKKFAQENNLNEKLTNKYLELHVL